MRSLKLKNEYSQRITWFFSVFILSIFYIFPFQQVFTGSEIKKNKISQKIPDKKESEDRIQNTSAVKSGVRVTERIFSSPRLKSGVLNLDSPSARI